MKRYFHIINFILLSFITSGILSCSSDEEEIPLPILEIDYNREIITFTAQALDNEDVTINVQTNQDTWNVVCDKPWCKVTKHNGYFVVSADECKSSTPNPDATIMITAGGATPIKIKVVQEGLFLKCTPLNDWSFTEEGGIKTLEISCNSKWKITSNKDWVKIDKLSGDGYDNVKVEVLQSNEANVTEAKLIITCGDIVQEINIKRDYKHKVYNIGDYYPDATNPQGVVFHLTNNGKNGLVVSLNQFSSYYSSEYYPLDATYADGKINTNKMIERGINLYPAANRCLQQGNDWFLPSRVELAILFSVSQDINDFIVKAGGEKIGYSLMSSNEATLSSYVCVLSDTTTKNLDKKTSTAARAILAF